MPLRGMFLPIKDTIPTNTITLHRQYHATQHSKPPYLHNNDHAVVVNVHTRRSHRKYTAIPTAHTRQTAPNKGDRYMRRSPRPAAFPCRSAPDLSHNRPPPPAGILHWLSFVLFMGSIHIRPALPCDFLCNTRRKGAPRRYRGFPLALVCSCGNCRKAERTVQT